MVIREQTDDVLVLGARKGDERAGLLFLGLGVVFLTVLLVAIADYFKGGRYAANWAALFFMAQYLAPCTLVGGLILFFQEKYIFDRRNQVFTLQRPLRAPRHIAFSHIAHIRIRALGHGAAKASIVLQNATLLPLAGGAGEKCREMAQAVAAFAGVACHEEEAGARV